MSPGKSVHLAGTAYDPIPDLAQLLAGLRALPGPQYERDQRAALAGLQFGPVARLVRGLGLGSEHHIAEEAIYEAVQGLITKTGHLLTRAELEKLAGEAERGYDPADFAPAPHPELGPLSGHQADGPANCRRCQMIRDNAHWMERQQALADAVRAMSGPFRLGEVRTVLSTVLSPEDYAELAELMDAPPGQDPRS